jgi:hypothetical protein
MTDIFSGGVIFPERGGRVLFADASRTGAAVPALRRPPQKNKISPCFNVINYG